MKQHYLAEQYYCILRDTFPVSLANKYIRSSSALLSSSQAPSAHFHPALICSVTRYGPAAGNLSADRAPSNWVALCAATAVSPTADETSSHGSALRVLSAAGLIVTAMCGALLQLGVLSAVEIATAAMCGVLLGLASVTVPGTLRQLGVPSTAGLTVTAMCGMMPWLQAWSAEEAHSCSSMEMFR